LHRYLDIGVLFVCPGFAPDSFKALDEADLKKARALLWSGEYSKVQVADELEISRHTLWRALSLEKTK
jgi:transcriptional regulator with PAS, ATPase and Fis domain